MVKHVILWKLKDGYAPEEKEKIMQGIKAGLESLSGKIPGMTGIHVQLEKLESSNADVMLETYFTDAASLAGYAVHPEHVAVADTFVRPYTQVRLAFDYQI